MRMNKYLCPGGVSWDEHNYSIITCGICRFCEDKIRVLTRDESIRDGFLMFDTLIGVPKSVVVPLDELIQDGYRFLMFNRQIELSKEIVDVGQLIKIVVGLYLFYSFLPDISHYVNKNWCK